MNEKGVFLSQQWQPELIKLTMVPAPEYPDGSPCFVNPSLISRIECTQVKGDAAMPPQFKVKGTTVVLMEQGYLIVEETPDEVNRRRNAALGKRPALAPVQPTE